MALRSLPSRSCSRVLRGVGVVVGEFVFSLARFAIFAIFVVVVSFLLCEVELVCS